jgi:hypothetical protein
MKETTADLLARAEKAVGEAVALCRENELLVANARRLKTLAELEKLRHEIYGPTEVLPTASPRGASP